MKNIKFLLLLTLSFILSSCGSQEERQARKEANRAEIYYLNEDFILLDAHEDITTIDGTATKTRTWKIQRVNMVSTDSVQLAEISNQVREDEGDCGCSGGNFYITNELWFNKKVGEVLHFDFIRKNRFYKLKLINGYIAQPYSGTATVGEWKTETLDETKTSDLDYTERLRLERKAEELQEELNEIRNLLN